MNDMTAMLLSPVSILMLDDHELVLEGLAKVLEEMPEVACTDRASNSRELLRKLKKKKYDIYLMDIELAGENGLDIMQEIRKLHPQARFIACTMHEESWILHALLRQNPDAIVLKLSGVKAIKEAVLAVREGRKYFCPRFEQMYRHLENARTSLVKKNLPTPREQEVLQAISEGLSTCEIAARLCLTENTVEGYRKNLLTKLEARNMVDLVVKAMQRGFLNPHNDL